jgi:hypothetical protein
VEENIALKLRLEAAKCMADLCPVFLPLLFVRYNVVLARGSKIRANDPAAFQQELLHLLMATPMCDT